MFAEKQIDIQGILALTSTIINLEININSKNTQKVKKKTDIFTALTKIIVFMKLTKIPHNITPTHKLLIQ